MPTLKLVQHVGESDKQVDMFYQANKAKFGAQAKKVLNILLKGNYLTQQSAASFYGVYSVSSRVSELRKSGVNVEKGWSEFSPGEKVRTYFLSEMEIERINQMKIV